LFGLSVEDAAQFFGQDFLQDGTEIAIAILIQILNNDLI
jgi:hypothetical protein